jgi:phosphoserine phosphatase
MRRYDLICFDVDGTLIHHPSGKVIWEILNLRFTGTDAVNQERYRWYREGRITYAQWVELDVQGWIDAAATRDQIVESVREFEHYDGVLETVWELRNRGHELAVISGTIDVLVDTLFPDHPFGDVFTNGLEFDDSGRLVGWRATPFDLHGKPNALRDLAKKHAVPLARTAFVGDGENDIPIVGVAGCVVAFNPRSEELARRADHVVSGGDMRDVLQLLG